MRIDLSSDDEDVLGAAPIPDFDVFVLWGVSPGQTTLRVDVDGERIADIPAEVVDLRSGRARSVRYTEAEERKA